MDGEKATETTDTGTAKVKVEKIPTEETILKIKLSGSGMNDFTKVLNVKLEKGSAGDLKVFFKSEDGDQEVVGGTTPTFSTTKAEGTVTVKTTSAEMSKVMVGGTEATLSEDKKSATYKLSSITGTKDNPQEVKVEVEFPYFKKAERTFKVAKYSSKTDFPLQLVSAKILSGDEWGNTQDLSFSSDSEKKASIEVEKPYYSTVKLVMEFDQELTSREVLECKNQRPENYATAKEGLFTPAGISGTFSGYVTHDVTGDKETELKATVGKVYTEFLILGYGTVTYKIKITGQNNKNETYIVEIKNSFETAEGNNLNTSRFMKNVTVFNGHSGRPLLYSIKDMPILFPAHYFKGSTFTNDKLSGPENFTDPMYMENVSLVFEQASNDAPYFYYNVMNDESSNPKDEGKFKRVKGRVVNGQQGNKIGLVAFVCKDLENKYLDFFLSGKETFPAPMISYLYNKKWTKAKAKHGWLLSLENKEKGSIGQQQLSSSIFFDLIFNYRIQTKSYDEQNNTGATGKYLTIAKNQAFQFWETAQSESGWVPFLGGKTGSDKDMFILHPLCDPSLITEVKYSIKCGDTDTTCTDVAEYKDIILTAQDDQRKGKIYKLGCKANETTPSYEFKDKIYKIEVEVKYNGSESDKLNYLLDYKNQQTLNIMDIADEGDADSNLFGVPTSYGMKTIDPAILKELANNSYTFIQGM